MLAANSVNTFDLHSGPSCTLYILVCYQTFPPLGRVTMNSLFFFFVWSDVVEKKSGPPASTASVTVEGHRCLSSCIVGYCTLSAVLTSKAVSYPPPVALQDAEQARVWKTNKRLGTPVL